MIFRIISGQLTQISTITSRHQPSTLDSLSGLLRQAPAERTPQIRVECPTNTCDLCHEATAGTLTTHWGMHEAQVVQSAKANLWAPRLQNGTISHGPCQLQARRYCLFLNLGIKTGPLRAIVFRANTQVQGT